jgi:hypothetical protein
MKKDLTLGIALILTGSIGLVAQNRTLPDAERLAPKKAQVLPVESKFQPVLVCQNKPGSAGDKTTLLEKLSVALSNVDSVVSLQRL